MTSALVSTEYLAENLANPQVRIIDASYFPPNIKRNPLSEYMAAHIPGAVFFDIDGIADTSCGLPHMLPAPDFFAAKMSELGIGNETTVIAYDSMGIFSAPRAWWMLRAMGHDKVFVLDGGLPKWLSENRPVTTDIPSVSPARFAPRFRPALVRSLDQVKANLESCREQVLDARGPGRFAGTEPEVWPGRRGGHIPHALNVPFPALLTPQQTLRSKEALSEAFSTADLQKPLTVSCGSGVSACVLALALYELGYPDVAVYDGSWAEWGLEGANHPVETGTLSTAG